MSREGTQVGRGIRLPGGTGYSPRPECFAAGRNACGHEEHRRRAGRGACPVRPGSQDGDDQLETAGHTVKIVYYEEDDILFIEFSKGKILRDESVVWNINLGYTADGVGEITILEAQRSGIYPLQIERVVFDSA